MLTQLPFPVDATCTRVTDLITSEILLLLHSIRDGKEEPDVALVLMKALRMQKGKCFVKQMTQFAWEDWL